MAETPTSYALDLIRYLARRSHAHLCRYVHKNEAIPEQAQEFIKFISKYFELSHADEVDWAEFSMFATMHSTILDVDMLDKLSSSTSVLSDKAIQVWIDMHYADEILEEAAKAASGNDFSALVRVQGMLDNRLKDSVAVSRDTVQAPSGGMEDVIEAARKGGIGWPLKSLDTMIGDVSNEFIIVASRPDGGKTTLLAQCAVHAATHIDEDQEVLWFSNEEAIHRVKSRIMSCGLNITSADIKADPVRAAQTYKDIYGTSKIIFIEDATHIGRIERIIAKYNPGYIIIDQLYKVRGYVGKAEHEAERFRQLCEWARGLAKHHCPVLVSNQLDGSAEGQRFPDMSTLYGSKTGAQGEADVILMIGRDSDPSLTDHRYFYTPKNKLTGRVMSTEVKINKDRAHYVELHP